MRALALFLFPLVMLGACNREVPIRAHTIYTGGTIYTGLSDTDTVEAVAVGDGLIVYAGTMNNAISISKDGANIINLGDAVMYPGFVDAHVHLLGVGEREMRLNLDQVRSIAELQAALLAWREANPDVTSIQGRGWIETHWPEGRFPMAEDLDAVIDDIPVVLTRADGHALVANQSAMDFAGITYETPVPEGGDILKSEDGTPNGVFIDLAMALLQPVFEAPDEAEIRNAIEKGYDVYAARGWTGLHNMSVTETELNILSDMSLDGAIPLRTYNAVQPDAMEWAINGAPSGERMTTQAVKLYIDGALGSRGALLSAPYADAPDTSGLALMKRDEALELFEIALDENVQIAMHAIGDRGNSLALDWMETAFAAHAEKPVAPKSPLVEESDEEETGPRWRIEHAQIVRPKDQARFADLGIIASMQPSHAIGDLHFAPARLGMDRLGGAYAWQSLTDQGVVVAGGSDAPVEVGDPMIEFYAASVRKDLTGFSSEGWHPEEKLSRYEALKLFTQNPAFASFQEDELGTIETGKIADFTVLDQDILTVPDEALLATRPVMTIVGGERVWQAEQH